MLRINYIELVKNFIVFVIVQVPMLHDLVLFEKAFGFFYIGFLLLIPYGLNRSLSLLIAFLVGLLIDIFSNSAGIHASACVLIAFLKDYWFTISSGIPDEDQSVNVYSMGFQSFLIYLSPLVLVHHIMIFFLEHGSFTNSLIILERTIYSSLFTTLIIFLVNWAITPKPRRS